MAYGPVTNGNDYLGGTNYNDYIDGYAGSDSIDGWDGNDVLLGSSGNDALWGGNGNDTLTGGSGSDGFVYTSPYEGFDYITDFTNRNSLSNPADKIYIYAAGFGIGTDQYDAFRFDGNTFTLYFDDRPLLRTNSMSGTLDPYISTTPYTGDIVLF